MAVFERPARHLPARALQWQAGRSRPSAIGFASGECRAGSGEAGGRYLKKIPPDLAVVKKKKAQLNPWSSTSFNLSRPSPAIPISSSDIPSFI
jgi:hypothetical protein